MECDITAGGSVEGLLIIKFAGEYGDRRCPFDGNRTSTEGSVEAKQPAVSL